MSVLNTLSYPFKVHSSKSWTIDPRTVRQSTVSPSSVTLVEQSIEQGKTLNVFLSALTHSKLNLGQDSDSGNVRSGDMELIAYLPDVNAGCIRVSLSARDGQFITKGGTA